MADTHISGEVKPVPTDANPLRIDPASGLALPDPFPEYVVCPQCGEAEVEAWCYQTSVTCHHCGQAFEHSKPPLCGTFPYCKRGEPEEPPEAP